MWTGWGAAVATVVSLVAGTAAATVGFCAADCNADYHVTADELVLAAAVALGAPAATCPRLDANGDARTTIDDLVRGVVAARDGCAAPDDDITVVNLNILHGHQGACRDTGYCRLAERVDLLFQWIAAAGCPDLVTLQEGWSIAEQLVRERAPDVCPFAYEVVTSPRGLDQEMLLSRYPVRGSVTGLLYGGFRHYLFARIDHPLAALDVFSTHLAASSDNAQAPCGRTCPAVCVAAGAPTLRDCQAVQLAHAASALHCGPGPALITGDFNEVPGSFVYEQFVGRGWSDVYLAAGNPECDPVSGIGCTSGRESDLVELESPVPNVDERIDFVFLVPPQANFACQMTSDDAQDGDRDGTATALFAAAPNPFAPSCGATPAPICWPSDHVGVVADLNCQ
jgi:endonuclease/exonuclease/phosphatase family metal-dependent hydrolase